MRYNEQDKKQFFEVLKKYSYVKNNMHLDGAKTAFIMLSVQLHALSGKVPKSYRTYIVNA